VVAKSKKVGVCVTCEETRTLQARKQCSRCYQQALRDEKKEDMLAESGADPDMDYVTVEFPAVTGGRKLPVSSVNGRLTKRQGKALAAMKIGAEMAGMTHRGRTGDERRVITDIDVVRAWLDVVASGLRI